MEEQILLKNSILIANGTNGQIYKAERTDTSEIIAAKAVSLDNPGKSQDMQLVLIKKELDAVLHLHHPNIVRFLGHQLSHSENPSIESPNYQILMEFCSGGTLRVFAQKSPVTGQLLQNWTRQLVDGIAYLHEQHYVHGNINDTNILLSSPDPETCLLKIGSIGHLKTIQPDRSQSRTNSDSGPYRFMAPEKVTGETDDEESTDILQGSRTDIWSLGCVVVEMITGSMPKFHKQTSSGLVEVTGDMGVMYFIGNGGGPSVPRDIPQLGRQFIQQCLKRHAKDRPSAEELKDHAFLAAKDWMSGGKDPCKN